MDISRIAKVVLKNSSPITDTHTKVTAVGGTLLGFQVIFSDFLAIFQYNFDDS